MNHNDLPTIDEVALDTIREIMEDEFPALVAAYLDEASRLLVRCEQAVGADDLGGLRHAAHALKSSSANIGAARLAETARRLEAKGRDRDPSGATPLLDRARSELDQVRARLELADD